MTRFYCEDGVSPQLAVELGVRGHVAVTADGEGLTGAFDEAHLWRAVQLQSVLITHNIDDFTMLHRAWQLWGVPQPHTGILLIEQTPRVITSQRAAEIDQFVRATPSLVNMLYILTQTQGWQAYP